MKTLALFCWGGAAINGVFFAWTQDPLNAAAGVACLIVGAIVTLDPRA